MIGAFAINLRLQTAQPIQKALKEKPPELTNRRFCVLPLRLERRSLPPEGSALSTKLWELEQILSFVI